MSSFMGFRVRMGLSAVSRKLCVSLILVMKGYVPVMNNDCSNCTKLRHIIAIITTTCIYICRV